MIDGGWWRERNMGSAEGPGDASLFQALARGTLLERIPEGAQETLPVLALALGHLLAAHEDVLVRSEQVESTNPYRAADIWLFRARP